ncbi:MAG: hypothetical protein ACLQIH_06165 [Myxococcaceae bacterium]
MTTRVGGEVDSFCGKCKMVLAHTVLAMVGTAIARVRCNTCGSDHAFRRTRGTATATPPRSTSRPARVVLSFEAQVEALGAATARAYSPRVTFQVDELISHPTVGLGIVRAVRQDKVDVAFKAAERTLNHGRPAATGTESRTTEN